MTDLSSRNYLKWTESGVTKIQENEAEDIQAVADMINTIQKAQWNMHRHCYSGTHARTQGIVKGTFEVPDDLPAHLKQGELFSKGGVFPVAARYSTEPGDPGLDDRIAQPRGFAMKIFNVQGDMYDAGKNFPTQDIEFNSTPAIDLADAKTTKEIIDLRIKYGGNREELYKHLEARDDTQLQKARDNVYNTHLESTRQYSQASYRFGDYVIRYCLAPESETQKALYEEQVKAEHGSDQLHKWLQDFHAKNEAVYLFQVQLLENLDEQLVEYSGTVWDAEKYPFQTVATLRFPKQDSFDYTRKAFWEDHIRVDPWHGLKAYEPLGSTNRLRRVVYPASAALRRKMNAKEEVNVKNIDEIPDSSLYAMCRRKAIRRRSLSKTNRKYRST